MSRILSVGPQEVRLERKPVVLVRDVEFYNLAKADPSSAASGIEASGLGKILPGSISVDDHGTAVISDERFYEAVKDRLNTSSVTPFNISNTVCVNIICFTF